MTAFAITSVAGMRIAFDRARGRLAASAACGIAGLSLSIAGNDLPVTDGGLRARRDGIGADAAPGAGDFVSADGSTAFFDAAGTEIPPLGGGPGEDSAPIVQGGADLLAGGVGEGAYQLSAAEFSAGMAVWQGGSGNDSIAAGGLDDSIWGEAGDDTLFGGPGADQLWGGAGNDSLDGGTHGDILRGGPGSDTLFGGAGRDLLTGQAGRDTFVIAPGGGVDTITDFTPKTDRIELRGFTGIDSFEAMLAATRQVGANVVIDLGEGDRVVLQNLQKSALLPGDFLFGA